MKEVIFYPPNVGEEVGYFESEHFVEEEAKRDPDSECTPLIDPWYDIHPYFPKIPDDYAPPSPSHVWLALYR